MEAERNYKVMCNLTIFLTCQALLLFISHMCIHLSNGEIKKEILELSAPKIEVIRGVPTAVEAPTPVPAVSTAPVENRQEVFQHVVQNYVDTGKAEYAKGYYREAEQTWLMAQKYSKYLDRTDRVELNQLLVKALQKQRANQK